jgi:hypothetical protein
LLPPGSLPSRSAIGIETDKWGRIAVLVDRRKIVYSGGDLTIRDWLKFGTMSFADWDSVLPWIREHWLRPMMATIPCPSCGRVTTDSGGRCTGCNADRPRPEWLLEAFHRVFSEIDGREAELLTESISADAISRQLDLPEELVAVAFRQLAESDAGLLLVEEKGESLLVRLPEAVVASRPWWSFSKKAIRQRNCWRQIRTLAAMRARLGHSLQTLASTTDVLLGREQVLLEQGRSANSSLAKMRFVGQVIEIRHDIQRIETRAAVIRRQLDIVNTRTHLLLLRNAAGSNFPMDNTSLTESTAAAENALADLQSLAETAEHAAATAAMPVAGCDSDRDNIDRLLAELSASALPETSVQQGPDQTTSSAHDPIDSAAIIRAHESPPSGAASVEA